MKYIVLSFDDGLLDFKKNACSILDKYKFKTCINIISGFSDKTVLAINQYLSISDISQLHKEGHEIANHTDSHKKHGSYEELEKCEEKIKSWCGVDSVGVVMPKYSIPNSSSQKFIKQKRPPYVTYTDRRINLFFNLPKTIFWKIKSIIKPNELNRTMFLVNHCIYKRNKCNKFLRFSINYKTDPSILYNAIKSMKDECCLTICFHSIVNEPFMDFFPEGSWTVHNLDVFCGLLNKDKNIKVVLQKEVCKKPN